MTEYDHSEVAERVAQVLREQPNVTVTDVSESNAPSKQWVETDHPLTAIKLQTVLEETSCGVTHYESRSDGYWTWFGYVRMDLDGPTFVDRR